MSARPAFVADLLGRRLPQLTPPRLTDSQNPPYSTIIRNQIADLQCHPLLESAVSLIQATLPSARL
jgi:hypothetical protein